MFLRRYFLWNHYDPLCTYDWFIIPHNPKYHRPCQIVLRRLLLSLSLRMTERFQCFLVSLGNRQITKRTLLSLNHQFDWLSSIFRRLTPQENSPGLSPNGKWTVIVCYSGIHPQYPLIHKPESQMMDFDFQSICHLDFLPSIFSWWIPLSGNDFFCQ